MSVKAERNTNMDFLRFVSMILIIVLHLSYYGIGWKNVGTDYLNNPALYNVGIPFEVLGSIGVNLFFLLSGYFQIHFKWRRFWEIVLTVYIYWFIIQGIGFLTGYHQALNKETILFILLPFKEYWFMLVYILLMLLSPFLNLVIDNIGEKNAKFCFFVCFMIFCGLCFIVDSNYVGVNRGSSLIFACFMYLTGAFIHKKYIFTKLTKSAHCFLGWAVCSVLVGLLIFFFLFKYQDGRILAVGLYNSPLIMLASSFFMMGFERAKENALFAKIGRSAKHTLAVYIIHSSNKVVNYYRNIPLQTLVAVGFGVWAWAFVIPYALLIYIVCVLIDCVFQATIGKLIVPCAKWIGNLCEKIVEKVSAIYS